ncbi:MAG: hypothetical protein JSS04_11795 [Proteobacteria bacterium]|nr:hypothetical protein [Pseudomonadota bacterium]
MRRAGDWLSIAAMPVRVPDRKDLTPRDALTVARQLRELARQCREWAIQLTEGPERRLLIEQAREWDRTAQTFEAEAGRPIP